MRQTKQKTIMREALSVMSSFFTAEAFYDKVKNKGIGIATVYRFLKRMKEKRELHSYLCKRKTIYSREENSHSHFICQKCGKVSHFDVDSLDFLKKKIKGDICHFQIDVSGVCEECLRK